MEALSGIILQENIRQTTNANFSVVTKLDWIADSH